mgnify:CR=1 FL=1|jgi:hypothetical protein
MIKYRVITKEVIIESLSQEEALMSIDLLHSNNSGVTYYIEEYNWIAPDNKRLGRDPDLH